MPSSPPAHITYCLEQIMELNPQSVLDVGCGMGRWGFLCREFLDGGMGNVIADDWQVRIDAVEVFEPYIGPHHRAIYSNIIIGDIRAIAPEMDTYDLIIAGDVIEHLHKQEALDMIQLLLEHSNMALMINIPLGKGWEQDTTYGNTFEKHLSEWSKEDFAPWPNHARISVLGSGVYGTFIFPRNCSHAQRSYMFLTEALHYGEKGERGEEERCLRQLLQLNPKDHQVHVMLAANLMDTGRSEEAIKIWKRIVQEDPGFNEGYIALAGLLRKTGQAEDADMFLNALLKRNDIPEKIRQTAESILKKNC